jgi:hypothetical protein
MAGENKELTAYLNRRFVRAGVASRFVAKCTGRTVHVFDRHWHMHQRVDTYTKSALTVYLEQIIAAERKRKGLDA